ncbi:MAG: glutamyl-tRNA reductase [Anaerolineales bacterium]|uniref:Glutamyl-tRNA reductase n=1 Tax=Candidatus Desulfolinea nitratireducens TaxID=2841698 RepID=A0A8J6NQU2_9CHLR|nr:glutamyl-tRNA reductase [Candidatus Desulfolinea nitratireducens]MBL6959654.1 glutamyl-tRNA reductase [Anaerolineales bacterium]
MHIHCLGINHHTASVSLREKLAFNDDQIQSALARQGCGIGMSISTEMIILSTCNRVEIYVISSSTSSVELEIFLSDIHDIPREELAPHLYHHLDQDAIEHLLRVAAGLNSLVLGEPQILGQVTHALQLARGQNTVGPILSRLFQTAIHAGKRARTETLIGRNPSSVSSLAASVAEKTVIAIEKAQIVVLGAGEMAELAVEALRKRGAMKILVVNRTLDRALALAERWGAETSTFEQLATALTRADILIASTGAPHTIIHVPQVEKTLKDRAERPLVMIDIAVPRDIDADVGDLPGVNLFNMDGLNTQLEDSLAKRSAEVPHVESILFEEKAHYNDYLASLDMLPLIANLREQAESIRQLELSKTLRRLPDLEDRDRKRIEALTQALVKKLVDAPIRRLRSEASNEQAPQYATVARALFDIPETPRSS